MTESPRHTASHRVEYALARTLENAVATLPEGAADAVGRRVGRIVHGMGIRRAVVEANLRLAYPAADDAWIRATVRAAYEHLGREAAAILRLSKLDREAVIERTDVTADWPKLEAALEQGRGVILVTGHYGNWEIAAAAVAARGVPIAAIVRRQGNRLVDARLDGLRRGLGVETIYQSEAPSRVPRVLRKGGVVGIVGDQDARRSGVFVPFFGRPASTHRGPALFALKLRAPVFACVARRLPGAVPPSGVTGGVFVRGRPVSIRSARDAMTHRIGFVPEDRKKQGLVLSMRTRENATLPTLDRLARLGFVDRPAERATVSTYFDRLRVRATQESVTAALSGGNQQKIVMAKWLAAQCDVLILDEPTRGVDVGAKAEIHAWVDKLASEGVAVLLISSELPELLNLSSRVLVLRSGLVVGELEREAASQDALLRLMAGLEARGAATA